MSAPFPNVYTLRKVAESASKACDVCYKHSTSVLITTDKKDFFYICPAHLKDRYFCTPQVDEEAAAKAKREKELAEETEKLKKEYAEKKRKKEEKKKEKEKEKGKNGDNDKDTDKEKKDEKKDDKSDEDKDKESKVTEDEPRVFELKMPFYQQRLQKRRQAEAAKRDRERASKPNYFPSVPSDLPTKK